MNSFRSLFLLFLLIPIIEIYLLIKIGGLIGAGWTIFLIIGTAAAGAYLIKMQGIVTFNRVQSALQRGEIPAFEMMEGLVLLVAGAFLLAPGVLTDTLGLLALIPLIRHNLILWVLKHTNVLRSSRQRHQTYDAQYRRTDAQTVIEGEYKKEKD